MAARTIRLKPAIVGETRAVAVDFQDMLESGELLTGSPTISEQITSDLIITNSGISTAQLSINDRSVAIGQAVQFVVSGQLASQVIYTIKITVSTDATPAQTLVGYVELPVCAS